MFIFPKTVNLTIYDTNVNFSNKFELIDIFTGFKSKQQSKIEILHNSVALEARWCTRMAHTS